MRFTSWNPSPSVVEESEHADPSAIVATVSSVNNAIHSVFIVQVGGRGGVDCDKCTWGNVAMVALVRGWGVGACECVHETA